MNIKSDDLNRVLEREKSEGALSPLWIIVGEEPLLALEAGDALRSAAKELNYSERVVLAFSSVSDWSGLIDAATSVSLFDDKKIIEVRFLSSGPGVKGAKILAQFAQLVPQIDSTVTVIHLSQVDYSTQNPPGLKRLPPAETSFPASPLQELSIRPGFVKGCAVRARACRKPRLASSPNKLKAISWPPSKSS